MKFFDCVSNALVFLLNAQKNRQDKKIRKETQKYNKKIIKIVDKGSLDDLLNLNGE